MVPMKSGSWPAEAISNGPCCLVRSFQCVVSRFPESLAVLHAASASTNSYDQPPGRSPRINGHFFGAARAGDVEYTYRELLSAVDSLAELLSIIVLNIGDAAAVIEGTVWEDNALLEIPETHRRRIAGVGAAGIPNALPKVEDRERRIGIMMVQSAEYLVSLLAVMKYGAAFVPLDLSWPPGRLEAVARTSKPCLVIRCHHGSWSSPSDAIDVSRLAAIFCCPFLSLTDGFIKAVHSKERSVRQDICKCDADKASYAYVLYTSGSTGNPRGVCGTEKGLMNRLRWMEETYPHVDDEAGCFKSAIGFVDHLTEALGPLLAGRPLIVPSQSQVAGNPLALYDVLQEYHVTRLVAVPSLMRAILPQLQDRMEGSTPLALRVLVLSGEPLHSWLWKALDSVLVNTKILNLYGSTEVSGDCTYFDCSWLRGCELEASTVPIGRAIFGCHVFVVSGNGSLVASGTEGELWVTGAGVAHGYFDEPELTAQRFLRRWPSTEVMSDNVALQSPIFKTGDFGTILPDGNILCLGRNDRLVKLHGQRIALEEVEAILQSHSAVTHAVVSVLTSPNGELRLVAYVVPTTTVLVVAENAETDDEVLFREGDDCQFLITVLQEWLLERLPSFMVPKEIVLIRAMPLTVSGKVDHGMLLSEGLPTRRSAVDDEEVEHCGVVQKIVQVFSHVLKVINVRTSDDFFALGGTSVSAAHVAYILRIDMHLLYCHPTPKELGSAVSKLYKSNSWINISTVPKVVGSLDGEVSSLVASSQAFHGLGLPGSTWKQAKRKRGHDLFDKFLEADSTRSSHSFFAHKVALARCNNVFLQEPLPRYPTVSTIHLPLDEPRLLKPSWRFGLNSCVDGSPLLASSTGGWRLFIGSHAKTVVCLDASSGQALWETQLGGRIESSAALSSDFLQVVIGCYDGFIYFLDFFTGSIVWTFKTGGEVKCQPTLDSCSGLIWCGSHDHKVYALDTVSQQCVWEYGCGGSVFGSPAVDTAKRHVYVGTTSGSITAIHTEPSPHWLWTVMCEAPIFSSLTVDHSTHFVICTLVNGFVTAITAGGEVAWKASTEGPIFGGGCLSSSLPGQLLVCSRDGFIYAFKPESGHILWKHYLEGPITSSCYVDDNLQLLCKGNGDCNITSRLVGVCTTEGTVCFLRINSSILQEMIPDAVKASTTSSQAVTDNYERSSHGNERICSIDDGTVGYAVVKLKLPGEIFSSPVVMGGRLFVGCRDNNVYALDLL